MPSPCIHCRPVPASVDDRPCGQLHATQPVVDGVGDDDVVARPPRPRPSGSKHRPFGSLNRACSAAPSAWPRSPDPIRRTTVSASAASSTRLWWPASATRKPPPGSATAFAGKRRSVSARLRRDVRRSPGCSVPRSRCSLDQLGEQGVDRVRVTLAGVLRDDVALRVDEHQGRPGSRGVGLPGHQLGVVEDRVSDVVPLDRGRQRHRIRLVLELRRVHPDHDQLVGVLLLDLPELVEDVQAVDAAERPEVEQHEAAAEVRDRVRRGLPCSASLARRARAHAREGEESRRTSLPRRASGRSDRLAIGLGSSGDRGRQRRGWTEAVWGRAAYRHATAAGRVHVHDGGAGIRRRQPAVLRLMTEEPWRRHAVGLLTRESLVQTLLADTDVPAPAASPSTRGVSSPACRRT